MITAICDGKTFGSLPKEKFEAIFTKIVELSNLLSNDKKIDRIDISAGKDIFNLFLNSSILLNRWKMIFQGKTYWMVQDNNLKNNELVINCDFSKSKLIISNFELTSN